MPVLLTSDSLVGAAVSAFLSGIRGAEYKKAAVIVTADPELRGKRPGAVFTRDKLVEIGFKSDFFDIEFDDPGRLREYDLVHFIGGNAFYLRDQMRKTGTDSVLRDLLTAGKWVCGASAGSMALGQTIALIEEFDPWMNNGVELTDLSGARLTKVDICPHYTAFLTCYDDFEARIKKIEARENIHFIRLNDGEAIVDDNGSTQRISTTHD